MQRYGLHYYQAVRPIQSVGAADVAASLLPPRVAAFVATGVPLPTLPRDLGAALNQIPRVAWGAVAAVAGYLAYQGWKKPAARAARQEV